MDPQLVVTFWSSVGSTLWEERLKCRSHTFGNVGFQSQGKKKNFGEKNVCLTSRSLGSRLVPRLLVWIAHCRLWFQDYVFYARLKTSVFNWSWKTRFSPPKKRGTNLETKLLEVRHMSRPKFFYLGFLNSVSKLARLCGLHASDHVRSFDSQSRPTMYVMWFKSVSVDNLFFKWSPAASDCCWFHVVSKMSQSLALVRPPNCVQGNNRAQHSCD